MFILFLFFFLFLQAYSHFNQDDITDFRAVFDYFDKNKTNIITAKQVRTTLRALEPKPDEEDINAIFNNVTKEKAGKVDFRGFLDALHTVIEKVRKQQIQNNKNNKRNQVKVLLDYFSLFTIFFTKLLRK